MNSFQLITAAINLGYDTTITVEADGKMWTGADDDRTYLTTAQVTAITKRATELEADKVAARQAVLDKLGLTADEASALLG
jgi:hypothetical protein